MLSTFGRTELRIPQEGGFQQPQDVYINDQVICAMAMFRQQPSRELLSRNTDTSWSFSVTVHQSCNSPVPYFKCLLTALVIWNMSNFLLPKIGCNLSSARISRLFFGFWRSCFLMCAQIFFVTSLRGSGSVPTILARSSEGCIGFIKALFFVLGVVFAIVPLHPCRRRA